MSTPFRELHNNSNASVSSYETAWSSSFNARRSMNESRNNMKEIKNEPVSENWEEDQELSILENNISMMSVTSPKSPAYRTPARTLKGRNDPQTPGDRMLQSVKKEEDRALLKKLYPEMFENSPQPPDEPRKVQKKIKAEPVFEEEGNEKENIPPGSELLLKEVKKEKESPLEKPKDRIRPRKIVISSDSEEDDDAFENYLKKLREKPEDRQPAERKQVSKKNFVVDDEYISEESDSSADLSGSEYDSDDDDYRESSPEVENLPVHKKKQKRASDDEEWFLQSLSNSFSGEVHEDAKVYMKENALRQKKNRESLLARLQDIFIRRIFSEVPSDKLKITWNARLRKSAGQCRNHSAGHSTVEMSPVVCTTAERVRDTLIHELCHAAVWIVDKLHKEGHGPGWKRWGARCSSAFRSLPFIERCHSYEIEAKFFYVCENEECGQTIKRQSKSLDTARKACGICRGKFELFRWCRRTNTRIRIEDPKAKVKPSAEPSNEPFRPLRNSLNSPTSEFSEFVKEHYWTYTAQGMKHKEVMLKLSEEFKSIKS